jgi:serine/threonine-protein kinase RsbW
MTVESRTENLEYARRFVADLARDAGFGSEDVSKIELAVDEACTNIIKHAYKYDPTRSISISVTLSPANAERPKFVVLIQDSGMSFDASRYHDPDMREYFRRYRVGGLGIMLMKKLMDEVVYTIEPGRPNEVTLVKYLPAAR